MLELFRKPTKANTPQPKRFIHSDQRGESYAADYLAANHYRIVTMGERDSAGELDIIAEDESTGTLVFVEVKTLHTQKTGNPPDRVDRSKQKRITHAALRYLKRKKLLDRKCRFDVIGIRWPKGSKEPTEVRHFISAFEASDDYQLFG